MNEQDRKLLTCIEKTQARLDERTMNIYHLVEKMEQHMVIQNGLVLENVKGVQRNTVWRKVTVGIGSAIIGWLVKGEIG